jgi:hypothetical protein
MAAMIEALRLTPTHSGHDIPSAINLRPTSRGTVFHQDSTSRNHTCSPAGGCPTRSLPDGLLPELIRSNEVGGHEKKDACGDCGGKGQFTYVIDGKTETKKCGKCHGTGKA